MKDDSSSSQPELYHSEFAFEIGSGLLTEVRRLQSMLAERDKIIQAMKEEKDDMDNTVEVLRTSLRSEEQNAGAMDCVTDQSQDIYDYGFSFFVQMLSRKQTRTSKLLYKSFVTRYQISNSKAKRNLRMAV